MLRSKEIALDESEKIVLIGIQNEAKQVSIQEQQTEIEIEEDTKNQSEDEDQMAQRKESIPIEEDLNAVHTELLVTGYLRSFVRDLPADVDKISNSIANYYWIAKIQLQAEEKEEDSKFAASLIQELAAKQEQKLKEAKHRGELQNMIRSFYYIYYDHTITGPFKQEDIMMLYITSKIEDEIWIKRADKTHYDWTPIKLKNAWKDSTGNYEFKRQFPELHNYLIPKMKLNADKRIKAPLDVPGEAVKKLPIGRRVIKWIGYVLLVAATFIVGLHMLPTVCVALCVMGIAIALENAWVAFFSFIVGSLGLIAAPIMIVYFVLLGEVDADYWNDEIQSWMIGYIAWGICSFLLMLPISFVFAFSRLTGEVSRKIEEKLDIMLERFFAAQFWILGVSFGSISINDLMDESTEMAIMLVLIFPASAAVLPSFIIGFIANFALEEKFELQCNDDYADSGSNLCYNDGSGCCEVISSHDMSNTYTFLGGLASNILATWAIIRICGYFLVTASNEASVFAQRSK